MIGQNPIKLLILGFFLVLFGFLAPLLMVIEAVKASLFLSFLSYSASVTGFLLGILGAAMYVRLGKS